MKERKPLPKETELQLLEFVKENSLSKTATKFGIGVDKVKSILKKYGVVRTEEDRRKLISKSSARKISKEEEEAIINFYKTHSVEETAKEFNYSADWIDHFLIDRGLTRQGKDRINFIAEKRRQNSKNSINNTKGKEIASYYINHGTRNTCKHFGIGLTRLYAICKEQNVEIRSREESNEMRSQTNIIKYGASYPLGDFNIRKKHAKNSINSNLEKRMEEFLSNNNFNYEHYYTIKENGKIHAFDIAIFKNGKLEILIDCDGKFYHGYLTDVDGKKVNCKVDEYRQLLVPEGVKFLICLEKQEEEAYKEILNLYSISYDEYLKNIFKWCREVEFPYPKYNDSILKSTFNTLIKADTNKFNMRARYGDKIINNFHPSIFKARVGNHLSPYEAWQDNKLLEKCIKNRIIYKGCNLDRSKVLAGFSVTKIAPKISIFNSYLAKYIVEKYLNEYNVIFDPCSGYSGRMLGTCSLNKQYIGQDVNPTTVEESNNIIKYFNLNATIKVKNLLEDSGEYPCLFTCPPYENKENWGQKIENKTCDKWIDECLNRYKCEKYIFVVDNTEKYKNYIIEEITNKSHFGENKEFLILISKEKQYGK